MLEFKFKDVDDNDIILNNPIYIVINQDEKIPADDLSVTFPLLKDIGELCEVEVFDDDKIVFKGVVDEQQNVLSDTLYFTKINARSMAANLLDNESRPVNYTDVSTSVIFSRHILPNAIKSFRGDNITYKGNLNISKGTTDWQAFYTFAQKAYNKTPRITAEGIADFNGINSEETLTFSNSNGIKYSSLKENKKRCKLISDVYMKTKQSGGYDAIIRKDSIISRKINRRRYVDISVSRNFSLPEVIINNSIGNSYEVTIITPERILEKLGAKVRIEDGGLGVIDGLYISSIYYRLTPDTEETTLILKKEREYVDS